VGTPFVQVRAARDDVDSGLGGNGLNLPARSAWTGAAETATLSCLHARPSPQAAAANVHAARHAPLLDASPLELREMDAAVLRWGQGSLRSLLARS
jgi:hypothetical protein